MAAKRTLTVEVLGDAKGVKGAFGDVEKGTSKLGQDFANLGKKVALAFVAIGAGAVVLGKKLIDAGEKASTSNARILNIAESMGVFGDAMNGVSASAEDVTKRLIDVAEKTARMTGVDQNAIKETQAKLLTFKELALTAGEMGGAFDRATAAAVDMAAAGFGDATSNAVQLGKALNDPIKGITALTRSGITFTEEEKKRIQTLVESNKMGEAQAMILEAIEKQVGGTAEATANASDKMKVAFSQLQERLGQKLLPVFEKLATFFIDKLIPAVEKIVKKVGEELAEVFKKVEEKVGPLVTALKEKLQPVLDRVIEWIDKNQNTVKVFFGVVIGIVAVAAVWALAAAFIGLFSPILLIILAIGLIAAAFYYAYTEFEGFREAVDKVVAFVRDEVVPAIATAYEKIKEKVQEFSDWFSRNSETFSKIWDNIKIAFETGVAIVSGIWDKFGGTLTSSLQSTVGTIFSIVKNLFGVLTGIFQTIGGVLSGNWGMMWDGIKKTTSSSISLVGNLISLGFIPIKMAFEALRIAAMAVFSFIFNFVKNMLSGTINFFVNAINRLIGLINVAIRAYNKIPIAPDIPQVPSIPQVALAKGGIVTGPTFALIGEAGPEAVVPLSGPYMPDFLQGDGGGGGTTINIKVEAGLVSSPDQVGQQIIEAIRRAERRSGQVFAAA
jgi:hypothetical protein